jgi:TRAP transporter TAXI family solute receptor
MFIQEILSRRRLVLFTMITALLTLYSVMAVAQKQSSFKWPATLTVATLGAGTSDYAMAAAMAAKLQESTGMKVRVTPQDISPARIKYAMNRMAELFSLSTATGSEALEGLSFYARRDLGPVPFRVHWTNGITGNGFMVRGDSKIKTIYDIKPGTKIAYLGAVPIFPERTYALLAWLQLDKKDVIFIPVSNWRANVWSVIDGAADVCVTSTISPTAYEAASTPNGTRWLSLPVDKDQEGVKRLLEVCPASIFYANKYGPDCSLGITMFRDENIVCCFEDTDEELIYQLTKWKAENFTFYKDVHPLMSQISVENMRTFIDKTFTPLHNGVIRYFKEIGKWTPADDARQKELLELLTRYMKAYKIAIERADNRGIKIDPKNNEWLKLWESYKQEIGLRRFKSRM